MPERHCGCLCSHIVYVGVTAKREMALRERVCHECALTENRFSAQSLIWMTPGLIPHAAVHLPKFSSATTTLGFLHVAY